MVEAVIGPVVYRLIGASLPLRYVRVNTGVMLPELPQGERISGMQLIMAQGARVLRGRVGQTSESVHLAMQGAVT